jgi:biotin carboxyl carrier protein
MPGAGAADASALVAPFPATVTEVAVAVGDVVAEGQTVVVIEAMKMLHTMAASGRGTVAEVRVGPGDQVESSAVLVSFAPEPGDNDEDDPREDDDLREDGDPRGKEEL